MHSQSALTEHVSLNLARFFLLDPVYRPQETLQGGVEAQAREHTFELFYYLLFHHI